MPAVAERQLPVLGGEEVIHDDALPVPCGHRAASAAAAGGGGAGVRVFVPNYDGLYGVGGTEGGGGAQIDTSYATICNKQLETCQADIWFPHHHGRLHALCLGGRGRIGPNKKGAVVQSLLVWREAGRKPQRVPSPEGSRRRRGHTLVEEAHGVGTLAVVLLGEEDAVDEVGPVRQHGEGGEEPAVPPPGQTVLCCILSPIFVPYLGPAVESQENLNAARSGVHFHSHCHWLHFSPANIPLTIFHFRVL